MKISRRLFLKASSLASAAVALGGCWPFGRKEKSRDEVLKETSPMDRTLSGEKPTLRYDGDNPHRAHRALWAKRDYLANKKVTSREKQKVVIVGGGMAGLASAFYLRAYKPVVLEQAPRFGGNSQGQSWQGVDYSIGAAYISTPDEGSRGEKLLREIGLLDKLIDKGESDKFVLNRKIHENFWSTPTDAKAAVQIRKLHKYFLDTVNEENGRLYPELPPQSPEVVRLVHELDRVSLKEHLEKIAGGPLHAHVQKFVENYSWSAFGASSTAISAAAGIYFLAAEFAEISVLPGGNAAITEGILNYLTQSIPLENFRARALTVDVKRTATGVEVTYEDEIGALRVIEADAVVMACPKFVAAKAIDGLEPERLAAIKQIRYHSYLVANVLLRAPLKADFYDMFLLGNGQVDLKNIMSSARAQGATDLILANFSSRPAKALEAKGAPATVLTLYKALPYADARPEILPDETLAFQQEKFREQVVKDILPILEIPATAIADVRVARWGHPMPVPSPGFFKAGVYDKIRAPFQEKIFFAHQDNWALPAFETSLGEAFTCSEAVQRVVPAT